VIQFIPPDDKEDHESAEYATSAAKNGGVGGLSRISGALPCVVPNPLTAKPFNGGALYGMRRHWRPGYSFVRPYPEVAWARLVTVIGRNVCKPPMVLVRKHIRSRSAPTNAHPRIYKQAKIRRIFQLGVGPTRWVWCCDRLPFMASHLVAQQIAVCTASAIHGWYDDSHRHTVSGVRRRSR